MVNTKEKYLARERRHIRLRKKLKGTPARPRLSVYKSNHYLYAQIIDDLNGKTLVSANSLEKELRAKYRSVVNIKVAEAVGSLIGERAKAKGINSVVFDRGGFKYHGRVKSLADAARKSGLEF
ncbi:MAG: 50S ribosomal protein L18 [Deferribacteraceae bacterium]|nr:50S ribosomal protein L18 [Deferribacteraceae bacterium]